MARYLVTPIDEKRLRRWEIVYGRSTLPIKYPTPQLACTQRWGDVAVYYLDVTAVPDALLNRLATYESRRLGISYIEARMRVRYEWLIRAEGCRIEKAEPRGSTSWQPAFPFMQQVPLRPTFHPVM